MTSLHMSYWNENVEVFKLLMSSNADPDIKDDEGESARQLANSSNNKQFLDILKDSNLAKSIPLDVYKKQE